MDSDLLRTINWKTTGIGAGFFVCKVVGWIWPGSDSICSVLETVLVSAGFFSSSDAGRVQNIVQAVDGLLGINKITPPVIANSSGSTT